MDRPKGPEVEVENKPINAVVFEQPVFDSWERFKRNLRGRIPVYRPAEVVFESGGGGSGGGGTVLSEISTQGADGRGVRGRGEVQCETAIEANVGDNRGGDYGGGSGGGGEYEGHVEEILEGSLTGEDGEQELEVADGDSSQGQDGFQGQGGFQGPDAEIESLRKVGEVLPPMGEIRTVLSSRGYPILRYTSAPNFLKASQSGSMVPSSFPKPDRRAYSLSIDSGNSIFPFPQPDSDGRISPPPSVFPSMYELTEFLQQDLPRSHRSPETWLPCPKIPRNNPTLAYFGSPAPRPAIPNLVNVTAQRPRQPYNNFPRSRSWWNYFYRDAFTTAQGTHLRPREEPVINITELSLPLPELDQWSMDVEAANTPRTPLTAWALRKHQKRLKKQEKRDNIKSFFWRIWSAVVDCFLMGVCAIWWFIAGCGRCGCVND